MGHYGLYGNLKGIEANSDKRRNFKISVKKREWNKAAGRDETVLKSTSKCRVCKCRLIWGNGAYNFDHKDNNPARNSQINCYLVCRNCHGKHTKFGVRVSRTILGNTYKRVKLKVGYKKAARPKRRTSVRRRVKPGGVFDFPSFKPQKGMWL